MVASEGALFLVSTCTFGGKTLVGPNDAAWSGETVPKQFEADLASEQEMRALLTKGARNAPGWRITQPVTGLRKW